MICPNCKNHVNTEDVYCGQCGTRIDGTSNTRVTLAAIQESKLAGEGRGFFKNVFLSHDEEILSKHKYSYLLTISLISITLIIISLLILKITSEFPDGYIPFWSLIKKIVILTFMIIGGTTGLIYALMNLFSKAKISFQKVLSDYILLNTFSMISIVLAILFAVMETYKISGFFIFLFYLVFLVSPLYILTKYLTQHKTSIASYYIILAFIVCQTLLTMMIIESITVFLQQFAVDSFFNILSSF